MLKTVEWCVKGKDHLPAPISVRTGAEYYERTPAQT